MTLTALSIGRVCLVLLFIAIAVWQILKRSEEPAIIAVKLLVSFVFCVGALFASVNASFVGPGIMALAGVIMAIVWTPHVGAWLCRPLTSLYMGDDEPAELKPFYSIAMAKRHRGLAREAIEAVEEQLENFPDDPEGLFMIADIKANDLHDLAGATATMEQLLGLKEITPGQIASALTALADWHQKAGQNKQARQFFLRLAELLPESVHSQFAFQRIAHIPEEDPKTKEALMLQEYEKNIGLKNSKAPQQHSAESESEKMAAACIEHLQKHPSDVEARERLASLYADYYQRIDLAVGELEKLITQPNQPARDVVRWLNLMADYEVKEGQDQSAAEAALQRIIDQFPGSAAAENARTRMFYLGVEMKKNKQSQVITLGSYRKNIGLE